MGDILKDCARGRHQLHRLPADDRGGYPDTIFGGGEMSGTTSSHGGLTRRSFLKTTGAVTGAAALVAMEPLKSKGLSSSAFADEKAKETLSRSYCRGNCGGICANIIKVREGRVVQSRPEDIPREYIGTRQGCVRGQFTPQRIYSPNRILHPMKRVEGSARGAGEWECVSWDEAVVTVSEKLSEIEKNYGGSAIGFYTSFGGVGWLNGANTTRNGYHPVKAYGYGLTRMAYKLGATVFGPSADLGQMYMSNILGQTFATAADCVDSDLILIWGCNPTDACRAYWPYVVEAKRRGAKLWLIDPQFTSAGKECDEYLPIRPGTDGALMLYMANYAFENELVDPYFAAGSVAPLLIREDGTYLKLSDLGMSPVSVVTAGAAMAGKTTPTPIDSEVVWDAEAGAPVSSFECKTGAIMGSFEVSLASGETVEVRTVWDYCYEYAKQYTLEKVAEICGLPAEKIEELARDYATCEACTLMTYQGLGHHNNSRHNYKNISLIASITGNINKPGASISQNTMGAMATKQANSFKTTLPPLPEDPKNVDFISGAYMPQIVQEGTWAGADRPLKALWVCNANPLASDTGRAAMIEAFEEIGFVVTADSYMTDTAQYSDVVFPISMIWEQDDIYATGGSFISLKVVEPLGEAKADMDLYRAVAESMGFDDLYPKSDLELIHEQLDTPENEKAGCTFDDFVAADGGWASYGDLVYSMPETNATGRTQFYLPVVIPRNDQGVKLDKKENMPFWEPPAEAYANNPDMKSGKYPLFGCSDHNNYHGHSLFAGFDWIDELRRPYVRINEDTAREKGIGNGDLVRVFNDHGECVLHAVLTKGIRPDTVLMPHGPQMSDYVKGHHQELTNYATDPVCGNSAFYDWICDVEVYEGGAE